jgi:two-component system sensor histidine kinase YesM
MPSTYPAISVTHLLLPFIENSLKHGLRKDEILNIKIKINKASDNTCIKIIITDNGMGILPERLLSIRQQLINTDTNTSHIGLFNTNKRIKLTYGDDFGIKLISKYQFGTSILINLPISTESKLAEKNTRSQNLS